MVASARYRSHLRLRSAPMVLLLPRLRDHGQVAKGRRILSNFPKDLPPIQSNNNRKERDKYGQTT
jgi:hypothetical protein